MLNLSKFLPSEHSDEEWNTEIKRLSARIISLVAPRSLYLFGSAISSERHRGSDIDLCIVLKPGSDPKSARRKLIPKDISNWPLDLLILDEKEFLRKANIGGVCQTILEEGQLLYGKDLKNNDTPD